MYYYEVWVNSLSYHSKDNLTYHYDKKIQQGSIVKVNLKNKFCLAIVVKSVYKPRFKTKPIEEYFLLPPLPNHLILLGQWLIRYYPTNIGVLTKLFLPTNQLNLPQNNNHFEKISQKSNHQLPTLTIDQKEALEKMHKLNTYILHGITGSGKTRIYLELIKQEISKNKSVIFLIPEISLISQISKILNENFNQVIVWHSQKTSKERARDWLKILNTNHPTIILGPRSAIFTPIHKLGLIIIDEAHETAYKQEQSPHYETNRVASYLAKLTASRLVLGSATPSINDYYLAINKNKPIIELKNKIFENKHQHKIFLIDLKDRSNFIESKYLSQELIKAIRSSLSKHEQTLLYLNRRGSARLIFCQNCGWQANCQHCDTTLTFHEDEYLMKCHSCDFKSKPPLNCPNCHYSNIIFKTVGTKAIASEVEKLFPEAKIARFDNDNLKKERLENNYQKIISGQIDILVGTQILAKGLDLLKLSTLGIVMADTSLFLPDYTSEERTYQLINQVIGRVNRGHLNSQTFIQTYQPNHPIIQQAINDQYQKMYTDQIALRKKYFFPPICSILKITIKKNDRTKVINEINQLKNKLLSLNLKVVIEGPTPAFHEKIKNYYNWQLIIKSSKRDLLLQIIDQLPSNTSYDIDPVNLL